VVQYINSQNQTNLYDPSYGQVYDSIEDFFSESVAGFAVRDPNFTNGSNVWLLIKTTIEKLRMNL